MNRTFGDYELLETLRAPEPHLSTYLATTRGNSRVLELRIFNPRLDPEAIDVAGIRKRLESLRAVSHPHLLRILDAGIVDDSLYYATDYRNSSSLAEYLSRHRGRLDPTLALDMLLPVGAALRQLHVAGFVHGDLSETTVQVEEASERAFLGTLSMVRSLDLGSLLPSFRSAVSRAACTPESAERRPEDARTDIWLFASVLYQAMTGRRLPTSLELAERGTGTWEPPTPPSKVISGFPEAVEKVLMASLARTPEKRPGSLGETLDHLTAVRERLQIPGSAPSQAIHLASVGRKQAQQQAKVEARRAARNEVPEAAPNPMVAAAEWFQGRGTFAKLATFALLVAASASLPVLVPEAVPFMGSNYESTRLAIQNKQFDRERIQTELEDSFQAVLRQSTSRADFEPRLRAIRAFAKALRPEDRARLVSDQHLADIRIAFAQDPDQGCKLLDERVKACGQFLHTKGAGLPPAPVPNATSP